MPTNKRKVVLFNGNSPPQLTLSIHSLVYSRKSSWLPCTGILPKHVRNKLIILQSGLFFVFLKQAMRDIPTTILWAFSSCVPIGSSTQTVSRLLTAVAMDLLSPYLHLYWRNHFQIGGKVSCLTWWNADQILHFLVEKQRHILAQSKLLLNTAFRSLLKLSNRATLLSYQGCLYKCVIKG